MVDRMSVSGQQKRSFLGFRRPDRGRLGICEEYYWHSLRFPIFVASEFDEVVIHGARAQMIRHPRSWRVVFYHIGRPSPRSVSVDRHFEMKMRLSGVTGAPARA